MKAFGDEWYASQIAEKSSNYARAVKRVFEKDIYPSIGNKSLPEVNAGDVLVICDRIKGRGAPQAALQTRNVFKRMYDYAIARQHAMTNPAQAVVARFVATQESRKRVLTPDEIGTVLRALYASDIRRPLKLAFHLLVLTMVRKSELTEASWDEFDLDESVWRIPTERMKKDKEHWVYLSSQAVAILLEVKEHSAGNKYLFPSVRSYINKPIAHNTLNQAIRSFSMDIQQFVLQ